jgi:tetratricopeptide (TPR) repeat protein
MPTTISVWRCCRRGTRKGRFQSSRLRRNPPRTMEHCPGIWQWLICSVRILTRPSLNWEAALKLAPEDASLHYNLGLAYKLKDQLDKAVREFQNAIRLQPDLADAHYTLGVLFWQRGGFDKAIEEMQTAIENQPAYAEAYYTLGTVLKQQGKISEAATALREAIRLQPNFAGAHTQRWRRC